MKIKTCKIIILLTIFTSKFLFAQIPIQLGYEFEIGRSSLKPNSFNDDQEILYYEEKDDKWLNDISSKNSYSLKVVLKLPFGLMPFVGYYQNSFAENENNYELWDNRYIMPFSSIDFTS